MKEYTTGKLRNIGLVGHGSEGKTTLAEAMLYSAGAIDRMGKVEDGNTVTDFDQEEINRGISISAALAPVEWADYKINVIDIPGYFDMIGELSGAMRAVEGAVIVVGSVSDVPVGAEKAWSNCDKHGISRMFFVNGMDKENANFDKIVSQLKDKFGTAVVPVQLPIKEGHEFKGYVNLLSEKAYEFAKGADKEIPVPASMASRVSEIRESIIEAAASADEALMNKYFEEGTLSVEEILKGLEEGIKDGSVAPVVCGSAVNNLNVRAFMDAVINFIPSPDKADAKAVTLLKDDSKVEVMADDGQKLVALVYKTFADNFVGKINYFKILSGKLTPDLDILNANTGKHEKLNHIYTMQGKTQIELKAMHAGDIGALAKLANTNTGDTLCDASFPVKCDPIEFPEPVISFAVTAQEQGEEDKVFAGLYRLAEEDPSFKVKKSTETSDTLISGQGDQHVGIIISKLENKFKVKAVLSDPQVAYRETIRKTVSAQGRHKKQSGGHGQFGDVWIEFSPIQDGSAEFEFVDRVVGGVVPKNFIPAVEKGLRECINKGVLAGYPVVNLRCALYDGSYHSVDSSEMAFKTAAHLAFKKGCAEANPVLLEPIYKAEVRIPDEYMGDIIGDANRRRGRIMGMNPVGGGLQEVVFEVPQSEMFKYATDLRSMTGARGSFKMTFERYEEVPGNIAQKVIAEAKSRLVEDED